MNDEMKTMDTTNLFYAGLKSKEKELLAQLHELKEEIANAEKDIINEKFDIAIQYLIDIEETFCHSCETDIDADVYLVDIIKALQQIR